jgi:hypothetical protein
MLAAAHCHAKVFALAGSQLPVLHRASLYSRFCSFERSGREHTMQVLNAQENLPSMEPPAKQPRLQQQCSFKVKLLNEHAQAPKRGSALAAGYDLSR